MLFSPQCTLPWDGVDQPGPPEPPLSSQAELLPMEVGEEGDGKAVGAGGGGGSRPFRSLLMWGWQW